MGLFKRLFSKQESANLLSKVGHDTKDELVITSLPFRKGVSEVFFGETYLGLLRFVAGRGCTCKNQYIFKPQNSRFVFGVKREEQIIKVINIVTELEYPKRLNVGYRDVDTTKDVSANQKALNKYVNDLYTSRLLKSIKMQKEPIRK